MLYYRNPLNTYILSISQFCTDEFMKYYKDDYNKFGRECILHFSELNETKKKFSFNKKPIVLGNWANENKGSKVVEVLKRYKDYRFRNLNVRPNGSLTGEDLYDFNIRKQKIYLESDIFLQISLCEGFSYAGLDALLCGLPVVASNVGVFYKDIPDDCFVKLNWERNSDLKYVKDKLDYAWKHKEELGRKGREWYLNNCVYKLWKKNMNSLIENFDIKINNVKEKLILKDEVEKNKSNVILIPYRDRKEHLDYFINNLSLLLYKHLNNLKIVIVEQGNDKKFNRGKLLNVGFMEYKENIDYVYNHDVDTIPSEDTIKNIYTLVNEDVIRLSVPHPISLGGIIKMSKENFIKVNGFPNNIWGWGIEDRALYYRAILSKLSFSSIFNEHRFGESSRFKLLPHKSNVETYVNEKKEISDIWREDYINKLSNKEKENLITSDGINNVKYKLLKKEKNK